jgi:hypothetical protein
MLSNTKRWSIPAVAGLLGISLAAAAAPAVTLAARSLCVNPTGAHGCYSSIQAAVNAAKSGATISVASGNYKGNITIKGKALSLIGAGATTTSITGPGATTVAPAPAVMIKNVHKRTVISGFTIQGATLQGILVRQSSHVWITNNTLISNDQNLNPKAGTCAGALPLDQQDCGEAVNLNGASLTTIQRNVIGGPSQAQANAGGILLSDEYGATHANVISDNTVMNNILDCGVTLASHPLGFTKQGKPVGGAFGVYRNLIAYNVSTGNGGAGVGIFDPTPGTKAYNNIVFHNIVSGNGNAGVSMHSHAPLQNLNGNKIVGNWIGLNNLFGDSDAGDMATTGVVVWSGAKAGAAPIANTAITGNTIVGGNHYGLYLVHLTKTKMNGNFIRATVPVYKANA